MMEKVPHTYYLQLDFPSEMWFWYGLQYRQKLSANLGFGLVSDLNQISGFRRALSLCLNMAGLNSWAHEWRNEFIYFQWQLLLDMNILYLNYSDIRKWTMPSKCISLCTASVNRRSQNLTMWKQRHALFWQIV